MDSGREVTFNIRKHPHIDLGCAVTSHILLLSRFSPMLGGMEVPFTADQEAQLARMATKSGTDAPHLVKDAALRLLEDDARFRAAVKEGIAQADGGEFIEEEEMDARFEQMLKS